jgi:hypothetical protein
VNDYQGDIGMKKNLKSIIFTGMLFIGIMSACNLPFISASQKATETPTLIVSPTGIAAPVSTPTESGPPASATPEFAPFCEAGIANVSLPAQCQLPIAEESSVFCIKKRPYNLILINEGATYQVQTKGFWCTDGGMNDGRQVVTCTGPMAAYYEVNVCDPACAIPTVQTEIVQCPQDYHYNNVQGCCTQELQQVQQNCVMLKLKVTSCVVNCGVFRKKSDCNKNSYACVWNSASKVCDVRK